MEKPIKKDHHGRTIMSSQAPVVFSIYFFLVVSVAILVSMLLGPVVAIVFSFIVIAASIYTTSKVVERHHQRDLAEIEAAETPEDTEALKQKTLRFKKDAI